MDGILICRVSDQRQQEEGYSLEAQEEAGRAYAKRKRISLLGDPYVFQETASKPQQRKKFRAIFEMLTNRKSTERIAVLVSRFSRFSRNDFDNANLKLLVREGRVELHLFQEGRIVTKESRGSEWLMTGLDALVAEHKAIETGQAAKEGMARKNASGWPTCRALPGYKNVEVEAKDPLSRRTRERIVVPDLELAPIVKHMFELRAEGCSLDKIRDEVKGSLPPGFKLPKSKVHYLLRHAFYGGRFESGGVWYDGRYELIIPPELFRRVQTTFEAPPDQQSTKRKRGGTFTGWIRCSECGCLVVHEVKKGKYDYWRCTNYHRVHPKRVYVTEQSLFEQFSPAVDAIQIDGNMSALILRELKVRHEHLTEDRRKAAEQFKRQLEELNRKHDKLTDLLVAGTLAPEDYERAKTHLREEQVRVTDQLTAAQQAIDGEYLRLAERTFELARRAKNLWNQRSPAERRTLLEELLSNPRLRDRTLEFDLRKPYAVMAEMTRKGVWLPE